MSDFFASLAARALGAEPALRPRLPSLHEPRPSAAWAGEVVAEVDAAPRAQPDVVPPRPNVAEPRAEAGRTVARPDATGHVATPSARGRAESAQRPLARPTSRAVPEAAAAPAGAWPPVPPEPAAVTVTVAPGAPVAAQPLAVTGAATVVPAPPSLARPPVEREAPARERLTAVRVERAAPPPAAEAPPVVHVTIGRIEVGAAAPERSARPSRPPRPEPALSLDEYLRRGSAP